MRHRRGARSGAADSERGSILLPVLVVLLLIASAATAMTLQMTTSLREKATRRDRLVLSLAADALVRSAGLALSQASATKQAAPFPVDGTPVGCRSTEGWQVTLAAQDQGGLIDLNKAADDLLLLVLTKAGLSGPSATTLTRAILARRGSGGSSTEVPARGTRGTPAPSPGLAQPFESPDELDSLPEVSSALYDRLRPLFTVENGSAGFDPVSASPALRDLFPPNDLKSPLFAHYISPTTATVFELHASIARPGGLQVNRVAAYKLGLNAGDAGRFVSWGLAPFLDAGPAPVPVAFCQRFVDAYGHGTRP